MKNMMKNPKLAQAISDASWGELVRQLEYKCDWYGRTLIKIDRWFPSSKRCGNCGHIVEKMPLNIRQWDCPQCGTHHDRDINAANNILAAGLAVSVCGATVRPEQSKSVKASAKKQKPRIVRFRNRRTSLAARMSNSVNSCLRSLPPLRSRC